MGVDLLNITGLKELEHQGPIVMVNLMRFYPRSLDGDGSGSDEVARRCANANHPRSVARERSIRASPFWTCRRLAKSG